MGRTAGDTIKVADPNKPKRVLMPRVPEDHTRIYFDIHNDHIGPLKKAAEADERSIHDFARVTVLRHARNLAETKAGSSPPRTA